MQIITSRHQLTSKHFHLIMVNRKINGLCNQKAFHQQFPLKLVIWHLIFLLNNNTQCKVNLITNLRSTNNKIKIPIYPHKDLIQHRDVPSTYRLVNSEKLSIKKWNDLSSLVTENHSIIINNYWFLAS
jgi:hypothetical protein